MEEDIIDQIKKKRNDLAYQIETLIQDFTNKTNYLVDRITIEYKTKETGLVPKDPQVRISLKLGSDKAHNQTS